MLGLGDNCLEAEQLIGQSVYEVDELLRVANGRSVAEEDELWLEEAELARRTAVLRGVGGEVGLGLAKAGERV